MSIQLHTLLNAVTASGAGASFDLSAVSGYQGGAHTVTVSGISGDTVLVEGSIDGSTWNTVGTVTANGMYHYSGAFHLLRGNVSVYGAGTITMKILVGILDFNVLSRLTSTRAGLMDNLSRLDVNVSSVSPASVDTNVSNLHKQLRKGVDRP